MSKQQEIIEGMAECIYYSCYDRQLILGLRWDVLSPETKRPYINIAELQLKYLHSQGVVIKVDRKLPSRWFKWVGMFMRPVEITEKEIRKSGWAAVAPLIEE